MLKRVSDPIETILTSFGRAKSNDRQPGVLAAGDVNPAQERILAELSQQYAEPLVADAVEIAGSRTRHAFAERYADVQERLNGIDEHDLYYTGDIVPGEVSNHSARIVVDPSNWIGGREFTGFKPPRLLVDFFGKRPQPEQRESFGVSMDSFS